MNLDASSSTTAAAVAKFLGLPLHGPDVVVNTPRPLDQPHPGALLFASRFDEAIADALNAVPGICVIGHPDFADRLRVAFVPSPAPRLDFARAAQRFFPPPRREGIAATAIVAPSARRGPGVTIGEYSVVGDGVEIGEGTELRHHVVLHEGTRVGCRCLIKSHTVIGEEGFGFEFEEDGTPVRIPHYGHVVIGDDVEIGAMNVIARATLGETRLADHVKTDDHVFIAHNVTVGENSVIIAGAEISGSVRIGRNVWIAPQACILNQLEIGDEALVGLGAVVTKSVPPNVIVAGNPAVVRRPRFER